jgi:hypothetical protein
LQLNEERKYRRRQDRQQRESEVKHESIDCEGGQHMQSR